MKDISIVSVVIPTYNRAYVIERTIRSVLSQTYDALEVVLVDDGSTDNTEEVVNGIQDTRLVYVRLDENSSTAGVPRNRGIEAARGEYIAFLDSDDEWMPEKLKKQMDKFNSASSEVGVVYCGYSCVNRQTGKVIIDYLPNAQGDVFQLAVEGRLRMSTDTPLIRRECFKKVGVFDTTLLGSEDWDMWIRLAQHCEFDYVPEVLAIYYVYGEQKSANLERQIQGYEIITDKYKEYLTGNYLSKRLQLIGSLCCYQGDFKKAKRNFREAIKANWSDVFACVRFLLCLFTPRMYQARLIRLRAQAARKQGGVVAF